MAAWLSSRPAGHGRSYSITIGSKIVIRSLAWSLWYLFIFILGLLTYPIIRFALPGLGDKGYPLARVLGLVAARLLLLVERLVRRAGHTDDDRRDIRSAGCWPV